MFRAPVRGWMPARVLCQRSDRNLRKFRRQRRSMRRSGLLENLRRDAFRKFTTRLMALELSQAGIVERIDPDRTPRALEFLSAFGNTSMRPKRIIRIRIRGHSIASRNFALATAVPLTSPI